MVTNYTATSIGDHFVAKINQPYNSIVQVLDWTILVGVSNSNTVGKLNLIEGSQVVTGTSTNLNLATGDQFIIGNLTFTVDQVTSTTSFTITQAAPLSGSFNFYLPEDADNHFSYQYRYSQNSGVTSGEMSEWRPLNRATGSQDLLGLTLDDQLGLWLDVRLEVDRLTTGAKLSLLSITFELETGEGVIQSCPNWCEECTDPYAMDGCATLIIDCDDALWNPYAIKKPTAMYRQLSDLVSRMFGHEVKYFRVEPDQRSRDVILMEYSLYNVIDQATLKVMVPDNSFPTREFNYDLFGMGFEEFEVHLTGEAFTKAFGIGTSPRSRDYLYFPLINRMWEVSTVALADEFNLSMTYWRLQLRKYENRTSSIHTDSQIEQELDDLIVGVEEIFGEEIQDEYAKVTKPAQFKTTYQELEDGIRASKHPALSIQDVEIRNRWTLVSKNSYRLWEVPTGERFALTYRAQSQQEANRNLAVSLWLRPQFGTTDTQVYTILDGRAQDQLQTGMAIGISTTRVQVELNGTAYDLTLQQPLQNGVWYGLVVNLNNLNQQLSGYLYRLDPDSNINLPHKKSGTLTNLLAEVIELPAPVSWDAGKGWSLSAAPIGLTNLRLFSRVIETEQHLNVLQQYVVRDAQLALITDNAIPSMQLRQYSDPR